MGHLVTSSLCLHIGDFCLCLLMYLSVHLCALLLQQAFQVCHSVNVCTHCSV